MLENEMPTNSISAILQVLRFGVGGLLLLGSVGWIGWMLWWFVRLNMGLEPSWDIALTYWYPFACVTFPLAAILALVGYFVIRFCRMNSLHRE